MFTLFACLIYGRQGDINWSNLPAGLEGNGEFDKKFEEIWRNLKKFEEIWEEIIQNEVSLGGIPTINVTLVVVAIFYQRSLWHSWVFFY